MDWFRVLTVLSVVAGAGCGESGPVRPKPIEAANQTTAPNMSEEGCILDGEHCQATAGYLILEDFVFLDEPGPHARLLTVRASRTDGLPGAFLEFVYSGEITSGEYQVTLKDPFDGGRIVPPTLAYSLPENHPSHVDAADDWRTAGEVLLVLDFDRGEFVLEFGPITFSNFVERERTLPFIQPSRIKGSLVANCLKGGVGGERDTPFCREELSKLAE